MNDRIIETPIAIVGAGPAGISAACAAAESGQRVLLIDDTPWLGGQIWRGEQRHPSNTPAQKWIERLKRSGATLLDQTSVVAAPSRGTLLAERAASEPLEIRWEKLILATGARELFLPFPGWTLPGVFGPGGLQALAKNGWPVEGKRIIITGSGPLLVAVADGLRRKGAHVVLIAEQAPWSQIIGFTGALLRHPGKLIQAIQIKCRLLDVPYHFGTWPLSVTTNPSADSNSIPSPGTPGEGRVRADAESLHDNQRPRKSDLDPGLTSEPTSTAEMPSPNPLPEYRERGLKVSLTDGSHRWTETCDYLACGFGLVPNVELASAIGCELSADGFVAVDNSQRTSIPGVYCAGEPTGIGGVDSALIEGQIAGFEAAGNYAAAQALFSRRAGWHHFRRSLLSAFALRDELKKLAAADTLLCRCEDVTLARVRAFDNWREAKLHTRCGMGACQGRICGAAAKVVLGWGVQSVRPPVLPARVRTLMAPVASRQEE